MTQLPLIDFSTSFFSDDSLEDYYIIGVQHILGTTFDMFNALFKKGLKPENVSLIGKCYSTCPETYKKMTAYGMDICPSSFYFDSHESFDSGFQNNIRLFLEQRKHKLSSSKKVILIDDGGELLSQIDPYISADKPIIGIEQTSSGYAKLLNKTHRFPIINLARANVKKSLEAPCIIESAINRLLVELSKMSLSTKKILIIGNGIIGSKVYSALKDTYEVMRFDVIDERSDFSVSQLNERLKDFDLIIGCTGTTSITASQHQYLKKGCVLLSISSSDREFDAVHLRKKTDKASNCAQTIQADGITLLNCGFPFNFTGGAETEAPKFIQFTRALIIISILQAVTHIPNQTGFIDLNQKMQDKIASKYLQILGLSERAGKYVYKNSNDLTFLHALISKSSLNTTKLFAKK